MEVKSSEFGVTKKGDKVYKYTIENCNIKVDILNYGGIIQSLKVKDKFGNFRDIVLGYDTLQEYEDDNLYFGSVIGRVANRIAQGHFLLNEKTYQLEINNGPNHLHGGINAFHKRIWSCEAACESELTLNLFSAHMDQGYPGDLSIQVVFSLHDCVLDLNYNAKVENADCPLNITNHSYFNLSGHESGSIENHDLQMNSNLYTPLDDTGIPTGEITEVKGTDFDFTESRSLKDTFMSYLNKSGLDDNFILDNLNPSISLNSKESGIRLDVLTSMPGVQIYTANYVGTQDQPIIGKDKAKYFPRCSICIETQFYPDSVNHKNFPNCILKVGEKYENFTSFKFSQF